MTTILFYGEEATSSVWQHMLTTKPLSTELLTPNHFQAYGQVIKASKDGTPFSSEDAQLVLDKGTPRFYIMRLQQRGKRFSRITRHTQCTQCLGSLANQSWLLAVCPPATDDHPDLERLAAFQIPGDCFIKLHVGTWHAGPYFDADWVDFYNLELSDTNINDHYTYDIGKHESIEFELC